MPSLILTSRAHSIDSYWQLKVGAHFTQYVSLGKVRYLTRRYCASWDSKSHILSSILLRALKFSSGITSMIQQLKDALRSVLSVGLVTEASGKDYFTALTTTMLDEII